MSNETLYPIFLHLSGRKVVVIGGGAVAERKVGGLLEAGAVIELVSPEVTGRIARWAEEGNIYHLERDFDQAILYYSKAIELSWGFAVAWTNRGDAYMAKDAIKEAMWDFNVACQLGYQPACIELHAIDR